MKYIKLFESFREDFYKSIRDLENKYESEKLCDNWGFYIDIESLNHVNQDNDEIMRNKVVIVRNAIFFILGYIFFANI
jgi:hypothetical protein